MVLAVWVRWSFRGTGEFYELTLLMPFPPARVSYRSRYTGATEDAVLGASSAARRHRHYFAEAS
jgi:hypothetical protein